MQDTMITVRQFNPGRRDGQIHTRGTIERCIRTRVLTVPNLMTTNLQSQVVECVKVCGTWHALRDGGIVLHGDAALPDDLVKPA
jgi:hypothetical protein